MAGELVIVTMDGPIFDGRTKREVRRFLQEVKEDVADQGVKDVRAATVVFKNSTGFYASQIQTDRGVTDMMVTDGGVVYGPWLEGTSSRNQTTRFKGYSIFRKVTQRLQRKVPMIVARSLTTLIRRMNG